jgi:CheY-like chemotaxis protein
MDGFEFLDAFNRKPEWRDVPVVVITAKELTSAERGLLSVRTVIEKGVSIDRDIAAIIGRAIGRLPSSSRADTASP